MTYTRKNLRKSIFKKVQTDKKEYFNTTHNTKRAAILISNYNYHLSFFRQLVFHFFIKQPTI